MCALLNANISEEKTSVTQFPPSAKNRHWTLWRHIVQHVDVNANIENRLHLTSVLRWQRLHLHLPAHLRFDACLPSAAKAGKWVSSASIVSPVIPCQQLCFDVCVLFIKTTSVAVCLFCLRAHLLSVWGEICACVSKARVGPGAHVVGIACYIVNVVKFRVGKSTIVKVAVRRQTVNIDMICYAMHANTLHLRFLYVGLICGFRVLSRLVHMLNPTTSSSISPIVKSGIWAF